MIKLNNIAKTYEEGNEKIIALDNIDLDIKEGEFVSIVDEVTSSKSTILNVMSLLDNSDSGKYVFDGDDISILNKEEIEKIRNQKIGFVSSNFNLFNKLTVLENVALPLTDSKMTAKEYMNKATKCLKLVGLEDNINNRPHELQPHQQQRVALARELIKSPKVLFTDELTKSFDLKTSEETISLIKQIRKYEDLTVVMTTNDKEIASKADRIIHIKDGKII